MIVFVKKFIMEFVSRVETSERGIGLLGFGVSGIGGYSHMLTGAGKQSSEREWQRLTLL
jgi:hypothetical protein